MDEFRLRFQHLYDSDPPLFADTHASSADSSCLIRFSFHCQPAFWAVIEEAWNNALLGDHNVKFALFGFHTEEELFQAVIDVNEKLPAFCDALSDILDEYPNHELRNFENQLTNVVETLDIPWFNFLEEGDNFDRAPECWVISMGLEFYLYVLTQPGRLSALGRAHLDGRAFSDVAGSLYSIRVGLESSGSPDTVAAPSQPIPDVIVTAPSSGRSSSSGWSTDSGSPTSSGSSTGSGQTTCTLPEPEAEEDVRGSPSLPIHDMLSAPTGSGQSTSTPSVQDPSSDEDMLFRISPNIALRLPSSSSSHSEEDSAGYSRPHTPRHGRGGFEFSPGLTEPERLEPSHQEIDVDDPMTEVAEEPRTASFPQ